MYDYLLQFYSNFLTYRMQCCLHTVNHYQRLRNLFCPPTFAFLLFLIFFLSY